MKSANNKDGPTTFSLKALQLRKTDFDPTDFHSPIVPQTSAQSNEFSGLASAEKFYTNQSSLTKNPETLHKSVHRTKSEKKFKSMKADWAFSGTSQNNLHEEEYHLSEISELSSERPVPIVQGPEIRFQVFGLQPASNFCQGKHKKNVASLIPLDVRKRILTLYNASVVPNLSHIALTEKNTTTYNPRLRLESSQIPITQTRLGRRTHNKSSLSMSIKNQSSATPTRQQAQPDQNPTPDEHISKKTSESSVMNSYQKLLGLCNNKLITHLSENKKRQPTPVNTQYNADTKHQTTKYEEKRGRAKLQLTPIYDCRLTELGQIGSNESSPFEMRRTTTSCKRTVTGFGAGKKNFSPLGERRNLSLNKSQSLTKSTLHAKKSSMTIIKLRK